MNDYEFIDESNGRLDRFIAAGDDHELQAAAIEMYHFVLVESRKLDTMDSEWAEKKRLLANLLNRILREGFHFKEEEIENVLE